MTANEMAREYRAQAERFIRLAELATEHKEEGLSSQPSARNNFITFEAVSISVCHGFAIEMLLKGLLVCKGIQNPHGHDLKKLLGKSEFADLKTKLKNCWDSKEPAESFVASLDETKSLFVDGRYFFEPGNAVREVNADFTSFLAEKLREELKAKVGF